MTKRKVLKNLLGLVGSEFDADDVICAFEDYKERGNSLVIVTENHDFPGYDTASYIDNGVRGGVVFYIATNTDNIVTDVMMIN
jgi:hypothetical protein